MTFLSYAQNFEDVMLWRALGHVERGFYIDLGAWDPNVDSVTRAFYERGWRGINVEPIPELARNIAAARPGDVTLELAVAESAGRAEFTIVEGTGLSSLLADTEERYAPKFSARRIEVAVETLAEICRRHARFPIHFLKIDVEGAERAALAGGDFAAFRPWIVLVEATQPTTQVQSHQEWEPILTEADYRFVWFDGLNRFYVAAEHAERLAPSFHAPPNSFDDFVRVADGESARRVARAEERAAILSERAARAEALAAELHASQLREALSSGRIAELAVVAVRARQVAAERGEIAERATEAVMRSIDYMHEAERRAREATEWVNAMRASTSWRLTRPVRAATAIARRRADANEALRPAIPPPDPVPALMPPSVGNARRGTTQRRTVHQFHSGSAVGDAVTQSMLLMRRLLRGMGYESDIFVEHLDPELSDELRDFAELPVHDDYVLIVHHSMGYDAFESVLGLPAPKVLQYHNITPPEFLGENAHLQRYARLGREQLASAPRRVEAALAVSEYNALELRRLGFDAPRACALLFDLEALRARAAVHASTRGGETFTILFVGRIIESKAQTDLVDAFARFRTLYTEPSRLVLVGRSGGAEDVYAGALHEAVARNALQDHVVVTGFVTDDTLHAWYAAADVYLSLSHHEGFGVPLVEAVAHGVPVLAWPCGAVAFTLGEQAGLLRDRSPDAVALDLRRLALNRDERRNLADKQGRWIDRFRLDAQIPHLLNALSLAGAAPPEATETAATLARALRFTIAGHVNKTYSLSAINRTMAMAIDEQRPGTVRLVPVESVPTSDLSEVPVEVKQQIVRLVERPAHATGPEILVSQHYPVYIPPPGGDARVALFFWEESLIPESTVVILESSFDAVFAPTVFVAKVLRDSGLSIPIHVVGHAPDLAEYRALASRRAPRHESAPFTFLHVSSCFPRKGVDVLLAAYARAFRSTDRVRLRIKGFPNPHNDAAEQVARLREADPGAAAIEVIDRDIGDAELHTLFAEADALVLPTRGEGFNLPAAEAMAAEVPVIVTGYGGHLDFCDAASARLLDYHFAPSGSHLATPHSVWVEPSADDLTLALRTMAQSPASEQIRRASGAVAARLDRAAYVERLVETSTRVLLTPRAAPVRVGWVSTWNVRCGVAEYSHHLVSNFPATAAISKLTIFADRRVAASENPVQGIRVTPCWQLGHPDGVQGLALAINQADPHVLILQHQPGLFHWDKFASLMRLIASRAVVVVLHNTRDVLDAPREEREAALAALARLDRVLVHTVADLNLLKDLGITENVTLMPHSASSPRPERAPRPLSLKSAPVIGCYGFFLPDKGIPQLVSAFARIRKSWPNARLRLVNAEYDAVESRDEIAAARDLAKAAGVEDAIDWYTDFLPDNASLDLLTGCDVIVLPYQRSKEASSAALRTALAAGPAVMVTKLGLFDEAGEAVARFDGTAPTDIARGIESLLSDVDTRARLQGAARKWLMERDRSVIARRLQGMLIGLARQRAVMRVPFPGGGKQPV